MSEQFKGSLNSRRVTGQSYYGNQQDRRFFKYCKIFDKFQLQRDWRDWYKVKFWRYSKNTSLMRYSDKSVTFTQRHSNVERNVKHRRVKFFPWREQ